MNALYRDRLKRWAHFTGRLMVVLAVAFVFQRIWQSELWLLGKDALERISVPIIMGAIAYMSGGLLLATAWWKLLPPADHTRISWQRAVAIHGKTQIAKYIPGNIFHLYSRHAYGNYAGLSHQGLLVALFLEIALTTLAAATLASPLLLGLLAIEVTPYNQIALLLCAIMLVAILLPYTSHWLSRLYSGVSTQATNLPQARLRSSLLIYVAFFLISSVIVAALVQALPQEKTATDNGLFWVSITTYTATAWLVGFLTPGASAGLGVRETTLVLLFSPWLGDTDALLLAISYRLVTITGDVGYAALPYLLTAMPHKGERR